MLRLLQHNHGSSFDDYFLSGSKRRFRGRGFIEAVSMLTMAVLVRFRALVIFAVSQVVSCTQDFYLAGTSDHYGCRAFASYRNGHLGTSTDCRENRAIYGRRQLYDGLVTAFVRSHHHPISAVILLVTPEFLLNTFRCEFAGGVHGLPLQQF